MAIQVGNSWVSESAYAKAKSKTESEQNANSSGKVSKTESAVAKADIVNISDKAKQFYRDGKLSNLTPGQGESSLKMPGKGTIQPADTDPELSLSNPSHSINGGDSTSLDVQDDFLANVNRMFDNLSLNQGGVNEAQREKFINRAIAIRDLGMGDITEQSKITGSFFREFSNVSIPSAGAAPTHEERLEALSNRYAEMRDELAEMFKDDEDEYNRQMEKLNTAFKGALDGTCLTPIYSFKTTDGKLHAFTQEQEVERIRFEEEAAKTYAEYEQYNKNVQDVMNNFRENLLRHVNTFYESFINSIQANDFHTAFQESMALLKNGETTSYNEIAYSDMVRIMDVLNNIPIEFDEHGTPTKMRYSAADQSFSELIKDNSIPYSARKAIADIFNYYIEEEQQEV